MPEFIGSIAYVLFGNDKEDDVTFGMAAVVVYDLYLWLLFMFALLLVDGGVFAWFSWWLWLDTLEFCGLSTGLMKLLLAWSLEVPVLFPCALRSNELIPLSNTPVPVCNGECADKASSFQIELVENNDPDLILLELPPPFGMSTACVLGDVGTPKEIVSIDGKHNDSGFPNDPVELLNGLFSSTNDPGLLVAPPPVPAPKKDEGNVPALLLVLLLPFCTSDGVRLIEGGGEGLVLLLKLLFILYLLTCLFLWFSMTIPLLFSCYSLRFHNFN